MSKENSSNDSIFEDSVTPQLSPEVVAIETEQVIDVDASWDGTGSLDDHRQKELVKLKQPGFGTAGKATTHGK